MDLLKWIAEWGCGIPDNPRSGTSTGRIRPTITISIELFSHGAAYYTIIFFVCGLSSRDNLSYLRFTLLSNSFIFWLLVLRIHSRIARSVSSCRFILFIVTSFQVPSDTCCHIETPFLRILTLAVFRSWHLHTLVIVHKLIVSYKWLGWRDSNPQPPDP